jgi:hypothetical protein
MLVLLSAFDEIFLFGMVANFPRQMEKISQRCPSVARQHSAAIVAEHVGPSPIARKSIGRMIWRARPWYRWDERSRLENMNYLNRGHFLHALPFFL